MRNRKPNRVDLSTLCGEIQDDDRIDPREFFKSPTNRKENRKARQLCRQVFETLSLVLCDINSDKLQDLFIVSVDPAPDASRLLVSVQRPDDSASSSDAEIIVLLNSWSGRLRYEIAAAITRKRVPTLVFRVARRPSEGSHAS